MCNTGNIPSSCISSGLSKVRPSSCIVQHKCCKGCSSLCLDAGPPWLRWQVRHVSYQHAKHGNNTCSQSSPCARERAAKPWLQQSRVLRCLCLDQSLPNHASKCQGGRQHLRWLHLAMTAPRSSCSGPAGSRQASRPCRNSAQQSSLPLLPPTGPPSQRCSACQGAGRNGSRL